MRITAKNADHRAETAIKLTEQVQKWVTKMVRRPECVVYEKIPKELGLFSPRKKRLRAKGRHYCSLQSSNGRVGKGQSPTFYEGVW